MCIDAYNATIIYYGESGMVDYFEYCISSNIIPREGLESATLYKYNRWIGTRTDLGSVLFFYLVPLIAVLPCGWNISTEINSGYLKLIVPKVGRQKYFSAKLLAAFLSGGTVIAIILLLGLAIMAALVPAIQPTPYNNMHYWVYHGDLFSSIAFSHPLMYVLIYIIIDFIFAGLFACMSLVVALHSESRIAALVIPYIVVYIVDASFYFDGENDPLDNAVDLTSFKLVGDDYYCNFSYEVNGLETVNPILLEGSSMFSIGSGKEISLKLPFLVDTGSVWGISVEYLLSHPPRLLVAQYPYD